jgi:hypothetical protein
MTNLVFFVTSVLARFLCTAFAVRNLISYRRSLDTRGKTPMIPALRTPAGVSMLPGVVSSSLSLVSSLPCKSVHLLIRSF